MPETAKPREPENSAPDQGDGKAPSAASREQKRDELVVWPRDMNAPTTKDPIWAPTRRRSAMRDRRGAAIA